MSTVLKVVDLVKQYKNSDVRAVNGINFEVKEGELFCLLGVNGAGKSTTINIICTLLEKTDGSVFLNELEIGKDDNEIRKNIGVVFQGNVLDGELTVKENIMLRAVLYGLTKRQIQKRLNDLSAKLNMEEFLNRKYSQLSGGQRRKCDIVRALITRPKVLFLDEPTTGLDPQSRIELWDIIETIRKTFNMTVFLTTHYMEETENADRVAIMDKGNILVIDTPQKLKSSFSHDILKLVVKDGHNEEIEKVLNEYEVVADTYVIKMKNGVDSISLLSEIRQHLHSYEMIKGNMDNVFLNVVGREYHRE